MKRAKQLQPLSRQHHLGLNISSHAKECHDDSEEIAKHWQILSSYLADMQDHFRIEDNLISNALQPYQSNHSGVASTLDTLEQQHKQLHELTVNIDHKITVAQVKQLATVLYDHLRFEERELFPIVEKYLTEDELDIIYKASPNNIKRIDEER